MRRAGEIAQSGLRAMVNRSSLIAAADAIRDALAAARLEVSDTPEGARWQPAESA